MEGANDMKLYNVYVYSTRDGLDVYMVRANDPVDARNVAVQRYDVEAHIAMRGL